MAAGRSPRNKDRRDYLRLNTIGFDTEASFDSCFSPVKIMADKQEECGEIAAEEDSESDGGDISDSELSSLKEKLENVKRKQLFAARKIERDRLKAEIAQAESALHKTQGTKVKLSSARKKPIVVSDLLTLDKLRKLPVVNRAASRSMSKLGLELSDSSTNSDSSDTDRAQCSDSDAKSKSGRKSSKSRRRRRYVKSGIRAKASDKVKEQALYPHAALQFEFVSENVEFKNLSFSQFVAGELEIITGGEISDLEMEARLALLKKLAYYYQDYSWEALRNFYAAWLKKIETRRRSWSDDPSELEMKMLIKHTRKVGLKQFNSTSVSKDKRSDSGDKSSKAVQDGSWYCANYQRNRCPNKSSHFATIGGKLRNCLHICSTCWRVDNKKESHPECASSCPHAI
jgi:hypothetical protein